VALPWARAARISPRVGIGLALCGWALLGGLHVLGAFETPDLKLFDWRYRLRGPRPATEAIALVEIDDRTVQAYDRWPLPRDAYAVLIAALEEAGARVIGLDLLFLGSDSSHPEADALLAGVTSQYENVVHAILFRPEEQGGIVPPAGADEVLRRHGVEPGGTAIAAAGSVSVPFTELADAAHSLAHVSVVVDRDGAVRRLLPLVRYRDRLYPSLGLRLFLAARGRNELSQVKPAPGGVRIDRPGGPGLFIPLGHDGTTAIDFAGDRDAFGRHFSMLDVLQWYRAGDRARLREAFQGRVVLVGSTAVGEAAADLGATPFSPLTPLVYVHANTLDALLGGHFLPRISVATLLAALAALSVLLGWLFSILPVPWAAAAMVAVLAAVAGANQGLFVLAGLDMPGSMALLLPPLAYAAVEGFGFISLERRTRVREKELQVARDIQVNLLPAGPPAIAELDVFGTNLPAQEIGGDYYDWVTMRDDTLAVALGDVSGKGVAAALLMSHLRASFHAETRGLASPRVVSAAIHESLYRATPSGRFATFFLARVPLDGGPLRFCNAGHNPGLLVRDGQVVELGATGIPLGMIEESSYEEQERPFATGDVLVLYSDGVTECPYRDEFYGDERLQRLVSSAGLRSASAEQIGRAILADVEAFCHGQLGADDITVVVVRRR
jgi:CHASE2 domain-containing sensor protein